MAEVPSLNNKNINYNPLYYGEGWDVIPVQAGILPLSLRKQGTNIIDSCWSLSRAMMQGRNDHKEE